MLKKRFPYEVPFINRIVEQKYLHEYFKNQPTNILFVYGPKSTGKTTLINKVINELPTDKYAINYLDMRGVLITNFKDFKNIFFPENIKGKIREIVSGIKINVGFFGRSVDDEQMLQTNIFELMESKLIQANENGIKPIIIIDEFQYLKNIIINKEDNLTLVEELWKFFIRLTKVKHLAHVVCLTSDSYYIEELYSHAKLKNTSKYYLVDHLSKQDIQYRLGTKEKLSEEIVEYFRENLGGSVREIRQGLVDYKNTGDYKSCIQTMIQDEWAKSVELYNTTFTKEEQKMFNKISQKIAIDSEFIIPMGENYFQIIKKLVDLDIWFYDVRNQRVIANSQSVRKAFQKIFN